MLHKSRKNAKRGWHAGACTYNAITWLPMLLYYRIMDERREGSLITQGRVHSNAVALSRRPCGSDCKYCQKIEEQQIEAVKTINMQLEDCWSDESLSHDQFEHHDIGDQVESKEH